MRTRFIRSSEIEAEQIEAVLDSSVNMFACGIGAPKPVVEAAKAKGQTTLALIGSPHHVQRSIDAGVEIIVAQDTTRVLIQEQLVRFPWSLRLLRLLGMCQFWSLAALLLADISPRRSLWALKASG